MYGHRSLLLGLVFLTITAAATLSLLHAAGWSPLAFEAALFAWVGCMALSGLVWQGQRIRRLRRANRRLALMLAGTEHPASRTRLVPPAPEPVAATQDLLGLLRGTAERPAIQTLQSRVSL